jgi:predicted nucleic acid-binding protein
MAWALPDERGGRIDRVSAMLEAESAWVPALFWYEVANVLAVARRRERIDESTFDRISDLFAGLALRTDARYNASAFSRYGTIARERKISAYDAAYLELALRRGFGLATLDRKLTRLAKKGGVPTLP